jgi:hypothetical protein
MLQFKNGTPFVGTIFLLPDPEGIDTLFTVVKGTFALNGGRVAIAEEQVPVALEEKYYGDPGSSSISVPSDVGLAKPGTDVLLIGHAHAPGGRAATQVDVSLSIGQVRKTIRALGDRVWRAGAAGAEMSDPKPFTRMPLVWERAYGGSDRGKKGPLQDARNPVGTGYRVGDSERPLDGLALPNLEDPAALISGWKDKPVPACLAPIAPHWEPRRSYAGTYDEQWQNERAPFLPADFDSRFFQVAPPGLVTPRYLRGGESVEMRGATPSGVLRFQLPAVGVQATYLLGGAPQLRPANLDTVLIEPDRARVILAWRAVLPCDKQALRVSEVRAELSTAA